MKSPKALFALILCSFATLDHMAFGQLSQSYLNDTGSPAYSVTIPVENGYIDVSNGNLHLEFPIASAPQRGSLTLNERLVYDSRIWMFSPFGTQGSYHWWPYNVYGASTTAGGWRFVQGNEVGTVSSTTGTSNSTPCPYPMEDQNITTTSSSIVWTDPNGTVHPFNAYFNSTENDCSFPYNPVYSQTLVPGPAADGSGYYVEDDGSGQPLVIDNNGTQVYPQIIDRYGNYWSTDANGNLIDDTGRIPVIVTQNGNTTYYDVLAPNGPISNNGTRVRYTVVTAPVAVQTTFQESDIYEWVSVDNPLLTPVQSIMLPDGSSYQFTYDYYGGLSSITLPTGGTITYGYTNFVDSSNTTNRWLSRRTLGTNIRSDPSEYFTPTVITSCANYSTGCKEQVIHRKANGDETLYELTLNNGAWNTGKWAKTGSFPGQALTHTTNADVYTNGCTNALDCTGANYLSSQLTTTEIFNPGAASLFAQRQITFDSSARVSEVKQWDYATGVVDLASPPSSTPTRDTRYQYLATDLQSVTVYDSNGSMAGQTTYGYTTTPAQTMSNITQHGAQNAGGPYLNTITHWLDGGTSPVTTIGVDDTGQVVSIEDPNHNTITMTYQCANSLPQSVANSLSQPTAYFYDCASGTLQRMQDPNDVVSNRLGTQYFYEAAAGRLHQITYPDGGSTTYTYPSSTELDTTVAASPDPDISSADILDQYGRPYQHSQNGITTETSYDSNGRQYCVTNSHTSSSASTDGSTCITSYDGLDRPLVQQQPDGNTVLWSYVANTVTTTDEAANQVQRKTDALGRLTSVVETPSVGVSDTTNYTYDGLGDLHQINQLGNGTTDAPRVRTFTYDSLARLITATTPESGSTSYSYLTNGILCSGDVSLPCSVTDARNLTTSMTYDSLNRLHTKQGPGINYTYYYDQASQGGFNASNPVGNLVWTTNNVDADIHYSYDPMGRVVHQEGCTPQHCSQGSNSLSAQYNLAGQLIALVYPDGRKVEHSHDASANIASVKYTTWNGTPISPQVQYFGASTPGGYDPMGHLASATLGGGTSISGAYDNRGRIGTLSYGPSSAPLWSKRYAYNANSNVQSITDQITGIERQFTYDGVNRLTGAQDVFSPTSSGSMSGSGTLGACTSSAGTGSSSSSGANPEWTNPDDSNVLINPDVVGAAQDWGLSEVAVSSNSVVAPDGTTSAATIIANPGSTDSYIADGVASPYLYNGESMVGSVWLRSLTGSPQTVDIFIVDVGAQGFGVAGFKQIQLSTAWQQYQVTGTVQQGLTGLIFQIGGAGSFTSGQSIAVWNPMLEDGGTIAPTVTNFLPYSQRLTAPTWGFAAASATDNSATAPDGTSTAATVTANSGSTDSFGVDNISNPAPYSGIPVTGSVWLRSPGGSQNLLLTLIESGSSGWQTLGAQTIALNSNWQRFQVTGTSQNSLSELQLQFGGANTFTNGQTIQVWGAQMELAAAAGPYVATAASPVTSGTSLTNILPYSQQPSGVSWRNSYNMNGRANALTAPDETQTGYEATAVGGVGWLTDDIPYPALYNSQTVTGSVYLRVPSGTQALNLYLIGENASGRVFFQQLSAQLTTTWQRFSLTGQAPNGMTRLFIQIGENYAAGETIDVWGAQMELASHAGPYVATSAMPVVAGAELSNILPNSQQLNGPSWGVSNGSVAANSAQAPDGTSTAATMNASGDAFLVDIVPNPSLYDGQTVTASVYLRVPSGTLNTYIYLINVGDNGWGIPADTPVTLTTTWQRFTVTGTNQNGLTTLLLQIGGASTITSGQSIQVWGAQMVPGTNAATYQATNCTTTYYATGQPAVLVPNGLNQNYSYDSFGNLLQNGGFNDSYTAHNQLFGYAYDNAGDLLSDYLGNVYSWDGEGKLTGNGSTTYSYDPLGNRVGKQGVGLTDTVYFGGLPIARYSAGQWTDFIYGPTGMLAEVPGSQTGAAVYTITDQLGSTSATLQPDGTLANPVDYSPFGQVIAGPTGDPYQFTGLEYDQESGLYHAAARQYASVAGRWLSPDPYDGSMDISNPQSLNRYSYVGNMPLNFTDPSGEAWFLGAGGGGSWGGWQGVVVGAGQAAVIGGVVFGVYEGLEAIFGHAHLAGTPTKRPKVLGSPDFGVPYHGLNASLGEALGLPSNSCEFGTCGNGFQQGNSPSTWSKVKIAARVSWGMSLWFLFRNPEDNPEWPGNGSLTPNFTKQDGVCSTGPFAPKMNGNPAILACCQAHDDCYAKNRCNASSWVPLPEGLNGGACRSVCNATVVGCIINAK